MSRVLKEWDAFRDTIIDRDDWHHPPVWGRGGFLEGVTVNMRDMLPGGRVMLPRDVVRIDRGSTWGNPHRMDHDAPEAAERASVVEAYRHWLLCQLDRGDLSLRVLARMAGKRLACWCAPKRCHGDVLALAAVWAAKELKAKETGDAV